MKNEIVLNVIMYVMYKKVRVVRKTTANGGKPQVEEKYNKVVVEILWEEP
jgi:hypothetical protein